MWNLHIADGPIILFAINIDIKIILQKLEDSLARPDDFGLSDKKICADCGHWIHNGHRNDCFFSKVERSYQNDNLSLNKEDSARILTFLNAWDTKPKPKKSIYDCSWGDNEKA